MAVVQVRDDGGVYWVVLCEDAEKQVRRNVMEIEWQDLLMDLMWGMRESRMSL